MSQSQSYKTIPALAAYIDRIGAEQLNFRRFMVKNYKGENYYVERCLIKLGSDGSIAVNNKDYAPTKEELAEIEKAFASGDIKWPKPITATEAQFDVLKSKVPGGSKLYAFHDRAHGGILMAQERRMIKGAKAYVPWTMWNDGEWRMMEPEGDLPFWKPKKGKPRGSARIMIHEGAKTAEFIQDLIDNPGRADELKQHPWAATLEQYEHWGMIGGALAPHRSDYKELSRERPLEVIYVCDNDYPGKAALKEVSKNYGHAIKGIMFDERWPMAWDMADEMPKALFTGAGRYVGPELDKLTQLATWATELVPPPEGAGRPTATLRKEFAEEWFHCVVPEVFVHRDWSSVIFTAQEFNNRVRPFSHIDDTARLVKGDAASKSGVLRYSPAHKPGIYVDEAGTRYINTHTPSSIKAEKGDPALFLEYLDHLVPLEEDRKELMRWCATLIAKPDTKMLYGLLLISETQGVGKGTLGERIMAPLIGEVNVSYPSEMEIVESNFNYWAAHKRLAVVHEIYAGHSSKAYNKLKSVVTDKYITVSKKYQANYEIENWVHILACSNSMRAIQLSSDDRRWFVPKIAEKKQPPAYWQELNNWLAQDGGLGIVKQWAIDFLKKEQPVLRGDAAPWSAIKKEIVEEGYSPGMALVAQFLERAKEEMNGKPVVIIDTDLTQLIRDQLYEGRFNDRIERPATVRRVAKNKGWFISEHRAQVKEWGLRGTSARLIVSDETLTRRLPSEISKDGLRPLDVKTLAQAWSAM